jgi:tripartite-type tricarboxylate transporter receptor subunit TctC
VLGQLKRGRLRALASLIDGRLVQVEGVPSIRELGWPDQVFHGGLFLFAPAALGGHAASLNGWLAETLRLPDITQRYRDASIEPTPMSLEQVRQSVADRLRVADAMRMQVLGRAR